MAVLNVLLPVFVIIALGAVLTWRQFLNREFLATLNRLAYTIGLPCIIINSVSSVDLNSGWSLKLSAAFIFATFITLFVASALAISMRINKTSRATFIHASYRGNLAYLSLPLVVYSFGGMTSPEAVTATSLMVLTLIPSVLFYNFSGVILLEFGRSDTLYQDLGKVTQSILANPLVLASVTGLIILGLGIQLPVFVQRSLDAMGQLALPAALLSIGGQLILTPQGKEFFKGLGIAFVKIAACPLIGFGLGSWLKLNPMEMKILLLMLASPTAIATYLLVQNLNGDTQLVSSAIVISSVLSFFSFGAVLALI